MTLRTPLSTNMELRLQRIVCAPSLPAGPAWVVSTW